MYIIIYVLVINVTIKRRSKSKFYTCLQVCICIYCVYCVSSHNQHWIQYSAFVKLLESVFCF